MFTVAVVVHGSSGGSFTAAVVLGFMVVVARIQEVTESRHFMEDFDSWSESSSEFGGSEEFTPRDEEFTARDEREEEVDPLVIEGGVDDGLVEPSELGANAELTAQCSPLESNVKVEPPLMYLPLLIRAAYVFLLRSSESRERGAHCPPYDGPIEKSPTTEEWDAEIDYLQSLMDEQDRKYGFEIVLIYVRMSDACATFIK
ncbi:hypothetical protein RHGRI_005903 [Rhododendron griersonianum]|uniref:Uncharacterized protein n=1 Tax=Rhododendron griersonianum TaxID=479676 RepID=A0AAV6LG25_9ERIC|nr:hypothetical protein RHGRI_005903 [Rhododendron griersonianum]